MITLTLVIYMFNLLDSGDCAFEDGVFTADWIPLGTLLVLSKVWEWAKLHSGEVQRQASISSKSSEILLSWQSFSGLSGLSIGPKCILEGSMQSLTTPVKEICRAHLLKSFIGAKHSLYQRSFNPNSK